MLHVILIQVGLRSHFDTNINFVFVSKGELFLWVSVVGMCSGQQLQNCFQKILELRFEDMIDFVVFWHFQI